MRTQKFNELLRAGEREAKIFALNTAILLDMVVLYLRDFQSHYVEGCDCNACVVRWIRANAMADMVSVSDELGLPTDGEYFSPELVHGGIEIKAAMPGKSLHRDDIVQHHAVDAHMLCSKFFEIVIHKFL